MFGAILKRMLKVEYAPYAKMWLKLVEIPQTWRITLKENTKVCIIAMASQLVQFQFQLYLKKRQKNR